LRDLQCLRRIRLQRKMHGRKKFIVRMACPQVGFRASRPAAQKSGISLDKDQGRAVMTATSRLPAWARAKDILDLIRLSVPIAVSRMAMMLMGLTDAIVLGQYAPGELAFVLSAWLPIGVSLGFGIGILLGVQVLTSE